jgi:hypothetical protein
VIHFFFHPWIRDPGWKKIQIWDQGSGINISDHISESLESIFDFIILKFFVADPGSGSFLTLGSGDGVNSDPDKHAGSATLVRQHKPTALDISTFFSIEPPV